jgi:membrane protease YdiL (CAAX protease family)
MEYRQGAWSSVVIEISIIFLFVLGFAFFLVWWAHEAERDRSAMVGLYLILGAPGFLIFIAGLAVSTRRGIDGIGPTLVCGGLGLILALARPVRVLLARIGDFDPHDPVHFLGSGILLGAIGFLGGQLISAPEPADVTGFEVGPIIVQGLFFVALAVIAVGYKIDRTLPMVIERLNITLPTVSGMLAAFGAVIIGFVLSAVGSALTQATNEAYARDIQDSLEVITSSSPSYIAAPLIGLSAGIGEELLFRGALQPRYGIVLSSLLFALLHSQYGFSFITLSTFLLGCTLGLLAKKYGVIHAIAAHTIYNMLAVIISAAAD